MKNYEQPGHRPRPSPSPPPKSVVDRWHLGMDTRLRVLEDRVMSPYIRILEEKVLDLEVAKDSAEAHIKETEGRLDEALKTNQTLVDRLTDCNAEVTHLMARIEQLKSRLDLALKAWP